MTDLTPNTPPGYWQNFLDNRERRLLQNCLIYAAHDPAGLPGHNLMLIVDKLARMLDVYYHALETPPPNPLPERQQRGKGAEGQGRST